MTDDTSVRLRTEHRNVTIAQPPEVRAMSATGSQAPIRRLVVQSDHGQMTVQAGGSARETGRMGALQPAR